MFEVSAPGATLGPWAKVDGLLDGGHIAIIAGDYGVCKVWNTPSEDSATNHANAHLIKASPALYDALVEARDSLATAVIFGSDGLFDEHSVGEHLVIARIDAALVLARGEAA